MCAVVSPYYQLVHVDIEQQRGHPCLSPIYTGAITRITRHPDSRSTLLLDTIYACSTYFLRPLDVQ